MKAPKTNLEAMATEKMSTLTLIEDLIERIEKCGFVVSNFNAGTMKEAMLDFCIEFDSVDKEDADTLKRVSEVLYKCSYEYTFKYTTPIGKIELLEPTTEFMTATKNVLGDNGTESQKITYRLYDYMKFKRNPMSDEEKEDYIIMNAEKNLAKVYIICSRLEQLFKEYSINDYISEELFNTYNVHRKRNEEYDYLKSSNGIERYDSDMTSLVVDDSLIERTLLDKYVCKTKTYIKNTKAIATEFEKTPEDIAKIIVKPKKRKSFRGVDVTDLFVTDKSGKKYDCIFNEEEM